MLFPRTLRNHFWFHTIATDNAGNVEAAPTTADAGHDITFQHAKKYFNKPYILE